MSEFSAKQIASFEEVVRSRRSVRGYLKQQVPEDILEKVFETARWSPSGTNVQPWHICVASGAACDEIRQGFLNRIDQGEPIKRITSPTAKWGNPFGVASVIAPKRFGAQWVLPGRIAKGVRGLITETTNSSMHLTSSFSACMSFLVLRLRVMWGCTPKR